MNQPPLTSEEWDELPPVLTTEQVARVLGVNPPQVMRWVHDGSLKAFAFGRYRRFSKDRLMRQVILNGEQFEEPGAGGPADR